MENKNLLICLNLKGHYLNNTERRTTSWPFCVYMGGPEGDRRGHNPQFVTNTN